MRMPTALELLRHCQANGIELFLDDGNLFAHPADRVPDDIARNIAHHKAAFILYFESGNFCAIVPAEARGESYKTWLLRNIKNQSIEHSRKLRLQENAA